MPEMEKQEELTFAAATKMAAKSAKVYPRLPLTIEKGDKVSRWRYLLEIVSNPRHFPWEDEEQNPENPNETVAVTRHGFSMDVKILDFLPDAGYKGEPIIPNGIYNLPFSFRPPVKNVTQKQSSLTNVITELWEKAGNDLVGKRIDLYTTNYPHKKHGKTRKYNGAFVDSPISRLRDIGSVSQETDSVNDDDE